MERKFQHWIELYISKGGRAMAVDYTEQGFETNIEDALIEGGYQKRKLAGKDGKAFKKYAIDVAMLFKFLEDSQQKELKRLKRSSVSKEFWGG